MKKTFIVIGLGRFGQQVAQVLAESNADLIAMDIIESAVTQISKYVNHCVVADSTKLSALEDLGVKNIDHAVVAIGNNLQASILTVMNLKKLGVKMITVRADEKEHKEVFYALGATEIIIPEESSAISLGNQILSDSILDFYKISDNHAIVQVSVSDKFTPKTLIELNLRNLFDVNIVGIKRGGHFFIPKGTDKLNPGDITVVVGVKSSINKLDKFLNPKKKSK